MKQKLHLLFKRYPALSLTALLLLFLSIETLYSFCTKPKSVSCPAFADANFDNWFPYQSGQTISFTSALNKKDILTIAKVTKSPAYTGTGSTQTCEMNAQITSAESYNATAKLFIGYYKLNNNNNLNLSFYNFQINGSLNEDNYIAPSYATEKTQSFSALTLNGKNFTTVTQVQLDTTINKPTGIYKIWLSKQNGLIGYEQYPSLERFVKD